MTAVVWMFTVLLTFDCNSIDTASNTTAVRDISKQQNSILHMLVSKRRITETPRFWGITTSKNRVRVATIRIPRKDYLSKLTWILSWTLEYGVRMITTVTNCAVKVRIAALGRSSLINAWSSKIAEHMAGATPPFMWLLLRESKVCSSDDIPLIMFVGWLFVKDAIVLKSSYSFVEISIIVSMQCCSIVWEWHKKFWKDGEVDK